MRIFFTGQCYRSSTTENLITSVEQKILINESTTKIYRTSERKRGNAF